jgi:hypothetical protein
LRIRRRERRAVHRLDHGLAELRHRPRQRLDRPIMPERVAALVQRRETSFQGCLGPREPARAHARQGRRQDQRHRQRHPGEREREEMRNNADPSGNGARRGSSPSGASYCRRPASMEANA